MKKISLFTCGLLASWGSMAQMPGVSPATEGELSANSSRSNGVSGVYNIDLFTGVANINIPIYDFSVDGLDLGVSFTYNTQGIRVDAMASEVGLGWTLNYGAVLERDVRGLEDDVDAGSYEGGWTYQYNGPNTSEDKFKDILIVALGKSRVIKFWRNRNRYPFYDMLGVTSIGSKASLKTLLTRYSQNPNIPDPPNLGDLNEFGTDEDSNFVGMIIYDEYGNEFYFRRGDYQKKEITNPSATYYATTKWVIEKIITKTGKQITYEYEFYGVNYPAYNQQEVWEPLTGQPNVTKNYIEYCFGKTAMLKKIHYPNGVTASFNYAAHTTGSNGLVPPKLTAIEISSSYAAAATPNKITYSLNQSYFHSDGPELTDISGPSYGGELDKMYFTCRLKLNSISRIGKNNHTEPYYSFTYQSTALPGRLSYKKDIYGYYNGTSTNTPLVLNGNTTYLEIPYHQPSTPGMAAFGADRASVPGANFAALLTSCTNNKGGKLSLSYSGQYNMTNVYPLYDLDLLYPDADDGAIVDYITEDDGYGNQTKTAYSYDSGQRFFKGGFFYDVFNNTYNNFPVYGYDTYNGCIHGYSDVTATRTNALTGEVLSKTAYRFDNYMQDHGISDPREPYTSGQYGQVLDSLAGHSYYDNWSRSSRRSAIGFYRREIKRQYMGTLLEQKEYDPNNVLKMHTRYYYELMDHQTWVNTSKIYARLKKTLVTRYEGSGIGNEFKTRYDYVYNTSPNQSAPVDLLMAIYSSDSKGDSTRSNNVWDNNEQVGTAYYLKKGGAGSFQRASYSQTGFTNSIPERQVALTKKNLSDAGIIQEVEYTQMEPSLINVKEALNKTTNRYSAIIWDTRINQKLAEADNAKYEDIAYTSFEGGFAAGLTDVNKGNWEFNNGVVGTISGVTSGAMTGKSYCVLSNGSYTITSQYPLTNGKRYILSFWSHLYAPKVSNGSVQVTMVEQFAVGNWKLFTAEIMGSGQKITIDQVNPVISYAIDELRLHPFDAAMTSYTYEPLFGVSSACDPRNNIVYQEYDNQGRPSVTRDIQKNILSKTQQVIQGVDN